MVLRVRLCVCLLCFLCNHLYPPPPGGHLFESGNEAGTVENFTHVAAVLREAFKARRQGYNDVPRQGYNDVPRQGYNDVPKQRGQGCNDVLPGCDDGTKLLSFSPASHARAERLPAGGVKAVRTRSKGLLLTLVRCALNK